MVQRQIGLVEPDTTPPSPTRTPKTSCPDDKTVAGCHPASDPGVGQQNPLPVRQSA